MTPGAWRTPGFPVKFVAGSWPAGPPQFGRPVRPSSGHGCVTVTLIVCASLELLLSCDTIISPRAGVSAHSAGLTLTVSVADPLGATTSNMPVLIAGVNALYEAVPLTVSTVLSVVPKATAWYVNRGLAAERHGAPALHSCAEVTGSTIVVLSFGASARNWIVPAPVCRLNTATAA